MEQKVILLVDDDPDIREALADRLADAHYRVLTARSGAEALQHIDRGSIDGVLLDIRMPGMDGVAVLTHMRQRHANIPVIVVTASMEKDKLQAVMKVGAADVVTKPVSYGDLLFKIK